MTGGMGDGKTVVVDITVGMNYVLDLNVAGCLLPCRQATIMTDLDLIR
jgi:hypothetical protein